MEGASLAPTPRSAPPRRRDVAMRRLGRPQLPPGPIRGHTRRRVAFSGERRGQQPFEVGDGENVVFAVAMNVGRWSGSRSPQQTHSFRESQFWRRCEVSVFMQIAMFWKPRLQQQPSPIIPRNIPQPLTLMFSPRHQIVIVQVHDLLPSLLLNVNWGCCLRP